MGTKLKIQFKKIIVCGYSEFVEWIKENKGLLGARNKLVETNYTCKLPS